MGEVGEVLKYSVVNCPYAEFHRHSDICFAPPACEDKRLHNGKNLIPKHRIHVLFLSSHPILGCISMDVFNRETV